MSANEAAQVAQAVASLTPADLVAIKQLVVDASPSPLWNLLSAFLGAGIALAGSHTLARSQAKIDRKEKVMMEVRNYCLDFMATVTSLMDNIAQMRTERERGDRYHSIFADFSSISRQLTAQAMGGKVLWTEQVNKQALIVLKSVRAELEALALEKDQPTGEDSIGWALGLFAHAVYNEYKDYLPRGFDGRLAATKPKAPSSPPEEPRSTDQAG